MKYYAIIVVCFAAMLCGIVASIPKPVEPAQQILPFRPRPNPQPKPAPLEESDGRLFARLRGHIEQVAEERAARRIEAALQEAADKIDATNAEGVILSDGEPSQFIGTSLFAGAILKLIWRVVKIAMTALILTVLAGLVCTYWPWILGGFTVAVTIVAWPIAWTAGKVGAKK